MKLLDLPQHKRPRDKLQDRGVDGLSEAELLAIVLRTGYQGKSALDVARRLLGRTSLDQLLQLPLPELAKLKGVGLSRACTLIAAAGLVKMAQTNQHNHALTKPHQVAALTHYLVKYPQEHVIGLYLNARNHVIHQTTLSIGTVNSALIHPREVFAPALEYKATALILVHNHPSGDPQPSEEDITVTERLAESGELLDIPILDHLIITQNGWLSFKQQQLL